MIRHLPFGSIMIFHDPRSSFRLAQPGCGLSTASPRPASCNERCSRLLRRRIVAERDTPGRAGAVCAQKTFFKYPGERRDYDDDSDLAVALTSASGAEVKLLEKASRRLRLMFFKLGMAGGPPTGMKIVAGEPWLYGRRSDGMRRQAPGAGDNKVQLAPGDQAFSSVFQV